MRALARRPELVDDVDVVRADLLTGSGLEEALDGCSTAYYLIHSMEAGVNGDFAGRDRRMAESVRRGGRARRRRADRLPGRHRPRATPRRRRTSAPGSRSRRSSCRPSPAPPPSARPSSSARGRRAFAFSFGLVERLRVLPLPRWRENRTQPIDERDVIEFLARTPQVPDAAGPVARRRRARRDDLRPHDRADRGGDGRRAAAARLQALAHPAGERRGRGGDRPAARAGSPADGEPRDRPPAARPRRGPAPVRHPARTASTARSTTRSRSGSAPSRWGPGEGRARHP